MYYTNFDDFIASQTIQFELSGKWKLVSVGTSRNPVVCEFTKGIVNNYSITPGSGYYYLSNALYDQNTAQKTGL